MTKTGIALLTAVLATPAFAINMNIGTYLQTFRLFKTDN